ncbi:hypothetical protein V8B97DRAFT_1916554 [Scleroderma yunnanense]
MCTPHRHNWIHLAQMQVVSSEMTSVHSTSVMFTSQFLLWTSFASAVCNAIITISIFWFLQSSQTNIIRSENYVQKLNHIFIQMGMITFANSLMTAILVGSWASNIMRHTHPSSITQPMMLGDISLLVQAPFCASHTQIQCLLYVWNCGSINANNKWAFPLPMITFNNGLGTKIKCCEHSMASDPTQGPCSVQKRLNDHASNGVGTAKHPHMSSEYTLIPQEVSTEVEDGPQLHSEEGHTEHQAHDHDSMGPGDEDQQDGDQDLGNGDYQDSNDPLLLPGDDNPPLLPGNDDPQPPPNPLLDLDLEELACIAKLPKLQRSLSFIQAIRDMSLNNGTSLTGEDLEQLHNPPKEPLHVDDWYTELSLLMFITLKHSSESTYIKIQKAIKRS